ncbi:MAG: asparagine synthase (glutamine-hydrolyzing) [Clostridia bacterium]|nr:asparagine synthase (glutamine-hydrolyzing) [Clostridia bacterium]
MCGIVGVFSKEENKIKMIKEMADKIIHRGADEEGYYSDEYIALGHRRLSIVDLDHGKQPMFSEDKKLIVIFNGEIYNYIELRKKLEKKYKFETNSDTEVLLHGYKEWGKNMPKKLRGMFAFAIWDKENKKLFCARDNFGIKPLYYYKDSEIFMFASEIKAFLKHPKFKKILNKPLLAPYLSFSFTPTSETFFKGVYCLEPGSSLIYINNKLIIEKYYNINFKEKNIEFDRIVNKIELIMKDSVKHHMQSDVEIGAFLSSGVDSSYIVSLAKPEKTYTVGYNISKYSEIESTKNLVKKLGIQNTSKEISKEEYIKEVPKILYHMDEPLADPSAVSLYFLSKLASNDVKVIVSGEGADEFFGGYNTYKEVVNFKFYNKIPFIIRHLLAKLFKYFPEFKGKNFIIRRGTKLKNQYIGVNKIFSEKEVQRVLNFKSTIKDNEITKPIFDKYSKKSNIIKMQAIDIKFWLVRNILLKVDKMTMANSIEARTPFIDKEVFKTINYMPLNCKISNNDTKIALRQAAKKYIPNEAYKKKKLGFPVPIREWIKEDDVYNEIKQTINKEFVNKFFNKKYVFKLLEEHRMNKKDNYKKIWAIYCFIKWYEIFFE